MCRRILITDDISVKIIWTPPYEVKTLAIFPLGFSLHRATLTHVSRSSSHWLAAVLQVLIPLRFIPGFAFTLPRSKLYQSFAVIVGAEIQNIPDVKFKLRYPFTCTE